MISDQTIGSARAEGNWNDIGQRIVGSLLTALLALLLVLASLTNLAAMEGLSRVAAEMTGHALPLPPIQYRESMPWMNWNASAPPLRIDTLMLPDGPPWADPRNPQVGTKGSTALS
jgi:hypothetical protein